MQPKILWQSFLGAIKHIFSVPPFLLVPRALKMAQSLSSSHPISTTNNLFLFFLSLFKNMGIVISFAGKEYILKKRDLLTVPCAQHRAVCADGAVQPRLPAGQGRQGQGPGPRVLGSYLGRDFLRPIVRMSCRCTAGNKSHLSCGSDSTRSSPSENWH